MFPPLADEWWEQVQAQRNWNNSGRQDFVRLQQKYGITWVVLRSSNNRGLDCPYSNSVVMVCRVAP
jgi:hypothetical protein